MPINISFQKMYLIAAGDLAKEHVKITTLREGILTTVSELRLPKDEEEDFDEGFVHKLPPEVLTKGHTVLVAAERKDKIAEGMEFSDYLLNSTKHKFVRTVRIYSIVTQATKRFAALVKVDMKVTEERKISFSMFPARLLNLRKSFAGKYYALMTGGLEKSELPSVFKDRKSAAAVINEVNGRDCNAGMPSVILTDKDSVIMKDFSEAEVNIKEINLVLLEENGVQFKIWPVNGNNLI